MVTCKDCYYFNNGFCSNTDSVVSEKEIVCCGYYPKKLNKIPGYVDKSLIIEKERKKQHE